MAEKKLKRDIDMTVQELQEVRDALLQKLFPAYTWMKTAGMVLVCLIGVKILLRIAGLIFSLLWGNKLLIAVITMLILSRKNPSF
jgi:hypothetical protein